MLSLGSALVNGTLYLKENIFVDKSVYDAVEIGQSLTVKRAA
jgi:hypothetical protein